MKKIKCIKFLSSLLLSSCIFAVSAQAATTTYTITTKPMEIKINPAEKSKTVVINGSDIFNFLTNSKSMTFSPDLINSMKSIVPAKSTIPVNNQANPKLQNLAQEVQNTLQLFKSIYRDIMDVSVTAEGNSIIYTYTYLKDISDVDLLKSGLEKGLEANKSIFETLVNKLKDEQIESPSVIVRYVTKDGILIYSREFK